MVTRVGVATVTHQSCINLSPVVVSECGSEEWVWQLRHIRGVLVYQSVVFGSISCVGYWFTSVGVAVVTITTIVLSGCGSWDTSDMC